MRAITPTLLGLVFLVLSPQTARPQDTPAEVPQKSVGLGMAIAVANTVVPFALCLGDEVIDDDDLILLALFDSWVVGPFPGLVYAGNTKRGLKGMGVRLGTLVLLGVIMGAVEWSPLGSDQGGEWLLLLPITATLASSIWDTATIPRAVRRYNEQFTVSPVVGPDGRVGACLDFRW